MTAIVTTELTKRYPEITALDGVSIRLDSDRIHGLLGRNGAGKTTLMQLLTGQVFATSGEMRVLGGVPMENAALLSRTAFIQEGQKYPDRFRPVDVFEVAKSAYANWDQACAERLVERYELPVHRLIKKLSRGQLSTVGIIIGLASRAPLTFFDEPYLGLDAVARQMFFDDLLADYTDHPRTIVLSTHHIDEVANLLEHVVILDRGRVLLESDSDELHDAALTVSGRAVSVDAFLVDRDVLARKSLGAVASATFRPRDGDEAAARDAGLAIDRVSLQELFVHLTTAAAADPATDVAAV